MLAHRLSADPQHSVLLIEAGPDDTSPLLHVPKGYGRTLKDPRHTWYFPTEPEAGNGHRPFVWIRGKGIGGSSACNGMIYARGHPADFDAWEAAGNRGWGWGNMLAAYRQIEDHELGADEYRGAGGPLRVSIQRTESPLIEGLLAAGEAMGLPRKPDLNRPDLEGIGHTPATIWNGRRVSAASAFLTPVRRRRNLTVLTDTLVESVLFDGRRASGVRTACAGRTVTYQARCEIILAAGAIQTPRLLQLSGVGSPDHLRRLGIPLVHVAPGVGQNLREHKLLMLQWRLRHPLSINRELHGWRLYRSALQWMLTRHGPMATTYDLNAFIRTRAGLSKPDAQLTLSAFSLDLARDDGSLEAEHGLNVFGYPLQPGSVGTVLARTANVRDTPVIRSNHLTAEADRRTVIDMARFVRRMVAQPVLRPYVGLETSPGESVHTDEAIVAACAASHCGAHAIGTCRMGQEASAVVDERLRVRGVGALRVVDCSVMPTHVSGNTNAPVMALAWRAADLILEDRTRLSFPQAGETAAHREVV